MNSTYYSQQSNKPTKNELEPVEVEEEEEEYWKDENCSSLAPKDSASQIGLNRINGPRPMPSILVNNSSSIREEREPSMELEFGREGNVERGFMNRVESRVDAKGGIKENNWDDDNRGRLSQDNVIPVLTTEREELEQDEHVNNFLLNYPLIRTKPASLLPYPSNNDQFQEDTITHIDFEPPTNDPGHFGFFASSISYVKSKAKSSKSYRSFSGNSSISGGDKSRTIRDYDSLSTIQAYDPERYYDSETYELGTTSTGKLESEVETSYPPLSPHDLSTPTPFISLDPSRILPTPLPLRLYWDSTANERRIWEYQNGIGIQKRAWMCFLLALLFSIGMLVELIVMRNWTGSFIQTKPRFNFMIGPSASSLIHSGARFSGCMKFIPGVSDISWICLNHSNSNFDPSTPLNLNSTCSMSDICGFSEFPTQEPNQGFRFFLPIFLQAGILHLGLNLMGLLIISARVEKLLGSPKFLILFILCGINGFALGANFSLVGQPSVGASGAIFGTQATLLISLLTNWSITHRPHFQLLYLLLETIIVFAIGYIPGIDNFSHIGGFLMGLLLSISLFPIIYTQNIKVTKRRKMIWWGIRILSSCLAVGILSLLIWNFYNKVNPNDLCNWCRYLSCWPSKGNNFCKGTGLETFSAVSNR